MTLRLWSVALPVVFVACAPASGGGGTGGGSAGGGTSAPAYPSTVKLTGTIELTTRTYDRPGGNVVFARTSKGSFSGTSSTSDLGQILRYSFDAPFEVAGTQTVNDVTLTPRECTKTIASSGGSNLELRVGSPTTGGVVAQLTGSVRTTETGTCANGAQPNSGFTLNVPNDTCPDATIRVISNAKWLNINGDARVGYDFAQDVTCDAATVKLSISVQGL